MHVDVICCVIKIKVPECVPGVKIIEHTLNCVRWLSIGFRSALFPSRESQVQNKRVFTRKSSVFDLVYIGRDFDGNFDCHGRRSVRRFGGDGSCNGYR